ncbi:MAG: hypothetical protein LBV38_03240 [Alistipes sp.]|jgi:hypothetical protein|nr:hypothetical protein [Alistipes sp.]
MKKEIFAIFAATFMLALVGCYDDGAEQGPTTRGGEMDLTIKLPAPMVNDMGTRAAGDAAEFLTLTDINIAIAEGGDDEDAIAEVLWFEVPDGEVEGGVEYVFEDGELNVHFSTDWFEERDEIDAATAIFFIVGNYGTEIDVSTVGALRNLRDEGNGGWVRRNPMMFGESVELGEGDEEYDEHVNEVGHEGGRSLKVALTPTVAMVTVAIVAADGEGVAGEGEGLDYGVVITPRRVSLHNVPRYGLIGQENILANGGAVAVNGEYSDVNWGNLASSSTQSGLGTTVPVAQDSQRSLGGHYTVEGGEIVDYGSTVEPLFLYENMQGMGEPNGDQRWKRPAGVAQNIEAIWAAEATAMCSYLEVQADYYDDNSKQYGTATWRVFLGGNLTENFDIQRGVYYRFTLVLSGGGLTESDVTWRVDSNLANMELSESDFVLNGTGEMIVIEQLHEGNGQEQRRYNMEVQSWSDENEDPVAPFVFIETGNNDNHGNFEWEYLGQNTNDWFYGNGGESWVFKMYVQPFLGPGRMRNVTFRLVGQNTGTTTPWITITQYSPLTVTDDGKTIYIDRLDRDAIPWGFETQNIAENQPSGYENGYALLSQGGQYMPFGQPGSAIMHAALKHDTQWDGVPDRTAEEIDGNNTLPDVPTDGLMFAIPSVEEWEWLKALDDGAPLFDPAFPVLPWQGYWTSDAVVTGSGQSYVYSLDGGDVATERSAAVKYRMIYTSATQ